MKRWKREERDLGAEVREDDGLRVLKSQRGDAHQDDVLSYDIKT